MGSATRKPLSCGAHQDLRGKYRVPSETLLRKVPSSAAPVADNPDNFKMKPSPSKATACRPHHPSREPRQYFEKSTNHNHMLRWTLARRCKYLDRTSCPKSAEKGCGSIWRYESSHPETGLAPASPVFSKWRNLKCAHIACISPLRSMHSCNRDTSPQVDLNSVQVPVVISWD